MSDYYLADLKAEEREQRSAPEPTRESASRQDMKVTLLGDFMLQLSGESRGFDPYNCAHGESVREAWVTGRDRR